MAAAFAIGAATAVLLCACSPGTEYPGFPSIHDMPAARTEAPMNAEEVKQATDNLITERTQLNTEAQNATQTDPPPPPPPPPPSAKAAGSAAPAAAKKKKKKPAPPSHAAATTGGTETAGADTKP